MGLGIGLWFMVRDRVYIGIDLILILYFSKRVTRNTVRPIHCSDIVL